MGGSSGRLTVVDVFTRECLAVNADSSLSGSKVATVQTVHRIGQAHIFITLVVRLSFAARLAGAGPTS